MGDIPPACRIARGPVSGRRPYGAVALDAEADRPLPVGPIDRVNGGRQPALLRGGIGVDKKVLTVTYLFFV